MGTTVAQLHADYFILWDHGGVRSTLPSPASATLSTPPAALRAMACAPGRARRTGIHAGRVEGRTPTFLVVPRELKVVALAVHPHRDVADAGRNRKQHERRVTSAPVSGASRVSTACVAE
jgi:hypothetical protein